MAALATERKKIRMGGKGGAVKNPYLKQEFQ
jgi:hypothetical protein